MPAGKASKASKDSASGASGVASNVLRIFGASGQVRDSAAGHPSCHRGRNQMLSSMAYFDGRMPTMLPEVQWP